MMRTTLTLDDDVAAMLRRARAKSPLGFKELVNDLLRSGLKQAMSPKSPPKPYRTPTSDGGECLLGSIANTEEVLDLLEGPLRR
jgi:hypothetical protein